MLETARDGASAGMTVWLTTDLYPLAAIEGARVAYASHCEVLLEAVELRLNRRPPMYIAGDASILCITIVPHPQSPPQVITAFLSYLTAIALEARLLEITPSGPVL